MNLFGKTKKQPEQAEMPAAQGRRRPVPAQSENRPQAFSYYSQRSNVQANTGRSQFDDAHVADRPGQAGDEGTGTNRFAGVPGYLGAAVLVLGLGYVLMLGSDPKVVTETAGGNSYFLQEPAVYADSAQKVLAASIFNKSKLTADTAKVSAELTKNYPEIGNVRVELPLLGHQPIVRIQPYRPTFILTTVDNTAFLLDENGRALVPVSQITDPGELAVPTLQDKSGLPVSIGTQAIPAGIIRFAELTVAALDASKTAYSSLVLPAGTSELDVYITGKPYFVKFNLQEDARLQAGTFLAVKQRLEKDRIVPGQYIDVRVPERAYYR